MELNHPPWTSTDHYNHHHHHHHHHQAADNVRSFKCSFCKRGFSNAQALGGHMNIHRKDRAKLRQLSDPHDHDQNHHDNDEVHIQQDQEHSYNRIRRIKRSNNKGIEKHQFKEQMPLFVEASQWASGGCSGRHSVEDYDDDEVGGMFPELDLELRLGPEPVDHRMAACLGTRNFF